MAARGDYHVRNAALCKSIGDQLIQGVGWNQFGVWLLRQQLERNQFAAFDFEHRKPPLFRLDYPAKDLRERELLAKSLCQPP